MITSPGWSEAWWEQSGTRLGTRRITSSLSLGGPSPVEESDEQTGTGPGRSSAVTEGPAEASWVEPAPMWAVGCGEGAPRRCGAGQQMRTEYLGSLPDMPALPLLRLSCHLMPMLNPCPHAQSRFHIAAKHQSDPISCRTRPCNGFPLLLE